MHVRFLSLFVLLFAIYLPAQAADLTSQRVLFLKAERALNGKQYQTFDKLMPELKDYPLYAWLQYRRLRKTISLKQAGNISEFLQREGGSRYAAPLKRSWLNYLAKKRRWADYVNGYQPQRNERYQCHYYWGLKELGKKDKALFGARDLWLVGRSQPKACNALFDWFQKSNLFTSALIWQRIELAMGAGKSRLAKYLGRFLPQKDQLILKRWLKLHRNPRVLLECPSWDGLGEWKSKIFVHAVLRLMRTDPEWALQVWEAEKDQFDLEAGRRMPVDNRLALKLAVRKNPLAREQLAKIPNEKSSSAVREWRVREALAQQAWPAVERAIERLPEQEIHLPRWRYWLARAKEEQGELLNVDETYSELARERSYYGFMASDRLNRHYSFVDRPVEVDKQVLDELALKPAFQVVKEFLYFKRETEARRQWWFAIKGFDQKKLLVASKLAQRWRWHQIAILTTARGKYWDDLSLRFPASYASLVEQNASSKKLDKALVYGIIRRESAFDRYARSPVGARGLMQIMPATGKEIARRLKEKWRSSAMLYKPEVNLHFGTDYFQQLLQKFDGNPVLAMAAYNAGGHRVNRWLPQKSAMAADNWIDSIPYKETRQYVSTILTYAVIYQRQLKQSSSRISAYMPAVAVDDKPRKTRKGQPKQLKNCH